MRAESGCRSFPPVKALRQVVYTNCRILKVTDFDGVMSRENWRNGSAVQSVGGRKQVRYIHSTSQIIAKADWDLTAAHIQHKTLWVKRHNFCANKASCAQAESDFIADLTTVTAGAGFLGDRAVVLERAIKETVWFRVQLRSVSVLM
jgi:predicted Zn-dependent protease